MLLGNGLRNPPLQAFLQSLQWWSHCLGDPCHSNPRSPICATMAVSPSERQGSRRRSEMWMTPAEHSDAAHHAAMMELIYNVMTCKIVRNKTYLLPMKDSSANKYARNRKEYNVQGVAKQTNADGDERKIPNRPN